MTTLDDAGLDLLFRNARSQNKWTDAPVPDDTLRELHNILKYAPTSANSSPARFLFLRTHDAKERLRPALSSGNTDKTMTAPVVCIVAHDPLFYDHLPRLFPHNLDARSWFTSNPDLTETTMFRNATLQGAYLIMAARALGLDCGPMSGFDNAKVDEIFLADRGWKSNFLCGLGVGDPSGIFPRSPRFDFDDVCVLL
jgi:3-hydroxypropanoate dehydrogenase